MMDKLPRLLCYAAMIGLLVLLMEHVVSRVKAPAKRMIGLT